MKFPPASTKRSNIARLCSREAPKPQSSPKVMAPRHSSETRSPVRPSNLKRMRPPSADELEVEVGGAEGAPQAHPQGQPGLRAPRGGDVAQIDDVLPAELAQQLGDARLGACVVAADE